VAVALVTVVLATVGEVLSLLALYNQRADSGPTILASGVLLTCMTAAGPAAAIARTRSIWCGEEFRFYGAPDPRGPANQPQSASRDPARTI
jgi:hypothetical protein